MSKIILDTNILVYSYDARDLVKHQFARKLLTDLHSQQSAVFPVQALAEYASVAQRKLKISSLDIYAHINTVSNAWQVLPLTPAIILEAARGVRDYQLSYFDAQIWATARLNQIPVIFSENFNNGAILEGVYFVNPFLPTFRLSDWL